MIYFFQYQRNGNNVNKNSSNHVYITNNYKHFISVVYLSLKRDSSWCYISCINTILKYAPQVLGMQQANQGHGQINKNTSTKMLIPMKHVSRSCVKVGLDCNILVVNMSAPLCCLFQVSIQQINKVYGDKCKKASTRSIL